MIEHLEVEVEDKIMPEGAKTHLVIDELKKVIAEFERSQESKTFSQRNPHLGKMINCAVCNTRHRGRILCNQRFALYEDDTMRVNEHLGKSMFHKVRFHPHPNKKMLQLVQRTQQLYPLYSRLEPINAMKAARAQAGRELRLERKIESRRRQVEQCTSRQINRRNNA